LGVHLIKRAGVVETQPLTQASKVLKGVKKTEYQVGMTKKA
jgi:hypothetical protein